MTLAGIKWETVVSQCMEVEVGVHMFQHACAQRKTHDMETPVCLV